MTHPAVTQMRAHWESLRAGRLMPMRSEIDPRSIEGALEFSFLAERTQPGHVRLRVAGIHLCDLMNMEVRGMPLRAFFSTSSRALFTARTEQVFETPEIQLHQLCSDEAGASPLIGQMLIMPLKSDLGKVDRAIGCLVTSGVIGPHPRRFRLLETQTTCLLTGSEQEAGGRPSVKVSETTGFAERQSGFGHRDPQPRDVATRPDGRPDLRVVKSEDAI